MRYTMFKVYVLACGTKEKNSLGAWHWKVFIPWGAWMWSVNFMAASIRDYETSCVQSSFLPLIFEKKAVEYLKWKELCFFGAQWCILTLSVRLWAILCTKLTSVRKSPGVFLSFVGASVCILCINVMVFCPIKVWVLLKNSWWYH